MTDQASDDVTEAGELDLGLPPKAETPPGPEQSAARRLGELARLEHGWLDGDGEPPTPVALQRTREALPVLAALGIRPRLFPTPEGGVQAEWTAGDCEASLTIEPDGEMRGDAVNVVTGETREPAGESRPSAERVRLIVNMLSLPEVTDLMMAASGLTGALAAPGPWPGPVMAAAGAVREALAALGAEGTEPPPGPSDALGAPPGSARDELASFTIPEIRAKVAAFMAECDADEVTVSRDDLRWALRYMSADGAHTRAVRDRLAEAAGQAEADVPEPAPLMPPGEYVSAKQAADTLLNAFPVSQALAGALGEVLCQVLTANREARLAWDKVGVIAGKLSRATGEPQQRPEPPLSGWGDGWTGTEEMFDDDEPEGAPF